MGQAQINVRTRACSGTFIARTKQAALTHNVRGKRLNTDWFIITVPDPCVTMCVLSRGHTLSGYCTFDR